MKVSCLPPFTFPLPESSSWVLTGSYLPCSPVERIETKSKNLPFVYYFSKIMVLTKLPVISKISGSSVINILHLTSFFTDLYKNTVVIVSCTVRLSFSVLPKRISSVKTFYRVPCLTISQDTNLHPNRTQNIRRGVDISWILVRQVLGTGSSKDLHLDPTPTSTLVIGTVNSVVTRYLCGADDFCYHHSSYFHYDTSRLYKFMDGVFVNDPWVVYTIQESKRSCEYSIP